MSLTHLRILEEILLLMRQYNPNGLGLLKRIFLLMKSLMMNIKQHLRRLRRSTEEEKRKINQS